jgi:TPR repeat protein
VERALADPPRFDYETSTRSHRRRYVSGALGDDRLAAAIDQAALATLRATAYLEASVRADERSQGARIDGRADLAAWHLAEARQLFEIGREWSGEMAVTLNVLAASWAAFAVDSDLDGVPLPADVLEEDLPPQAREALSRTGLVVGDLDLSIGGPEEARVLRAAGRSTVGAVALDSAVATRALALSAGKAAGDARALPRRIFDEPGAALVTGDFLQAERARQRGDLIEAHQYLLQAADRGSVSAMFEIGVVAHEMGDIAQAREWLDRAATLAAPLPSVEYKAALKQLPEGYGLLPPPKGIEGPGDDEG